MFKRYFENLSIHKIAYISASIAGTAVFIFAILIINQEYIRYGEEKVRIEQNFSESTIKKDILQKIQKEHKQKVMRYIVGIGGVALFLFFTIFMLLRVVSFLIEHELNLFINKLGNASKDYTKIDQNDFNFTELKAIIGNANELIGTIQTKHNELIKVNSTLEQKVKDKTKELQNLVLAQDKFIKKSIHEVNTPLSIILTNIDLLKMKNISNQNIVNIESGSKIIHNIFNDLSYMVKKDRIDYPKEKINLSKFLKQRLEFFNEVANASGMVFITNIDTFQMIEFNEVKLQRILDNNISNAIKYSFPDSAIFIKLLKENDKVIFSIKTNSEQIQDVTQIFSSFYRESDTKGGFGIGLNIVKDICDENSVKITLDSKEDETTFSYEFKKA
jgi:signal transduction histidine kinase